MLQSAFERMIAGTPRSAVPSRWGIFHCVCLILVAVLIAAAAVFRKRLPRGEKNVSRILFAAGIVFILLETGKQILCSFDAEAGVWRYDFSRFPFQFCSLPIWLCPIGAFCGEKSCGRICAFLASYGLFAGGAVLIWPSGGVFSEIVFLNFHTMIWHGLMVLLGAYLWLSETVTPSLRDLAGAVIVYLPQCPVAALLNEAGHRLGLPLDLFHFSPYFQTDTPLLSAVQKAGANGFVMMLSFMAVFGLLGASVFAAAALIRLLFTKTKSKNTNADFSPEDKK